MVYVYDFFKRQGIKLEHRKCDVIVLVFVSVPKLKNDNNFLIWSLFYEASSTICFYSCILAMTSGQG